MASPVGCQGSGKPSPQKRLVGKRIVLTYGTFDTLHHGHIRLLRRSRALGDFMIVGLATDAYNVTKGKRSVYSYEERKRDVEALRYVDMVIPSHSFNQRALDIIKYDASVITVGDDWLGKFEDFKKLCEVVYLERTPNISSSNIKKHLQRKEVMNPGTSAPFC
jgi:glycerol-3-phosphate cytidylyltransferase